MLNSQIVYAKPSPNTHKHTNNILLSLSLSLWRPKCVHVCSGLCLGKSKQLLLLCAGLVPGSTFRWATILFAPHAPLHSFIQNAICLSHRIILCAIPVFRHGRTFGFIAPFCALPLILTLSLYRLLSVSLAVLLVLSSLSGSSDHNNSINCGSDACVITAICTLTHIARLNWSGSLNPWLAGVLIPWCQQLRRIKRYLD